MYGWRARIGLIVPSTNTTAEPEFQRLAPDGVSVHTARAHLREADGAEAKLRAVADMNDEVAAAARRVAAVEPNVLVSACTTGSFFQGPGTESSLGDSITAATGVPAVVTAAAVIQALRHLGVRRLTMVTPYLHEIADIERRFFEHALPGLEIVNVANLNIGPNLPKGRLHPWDTYRMVRQTDTDDTDAVFISCCNWRSLEILDPLEAALGKPALSSVQASYWAAARLLRLGPVAGYGRLLAEG